MTDLIEQPKTRKQKNNPRAQWAADEDLWLKNNAGKIPFKKVVQQHSLIAAEKGWTAKTEQVIGSRFSKLKLSRRAKGFFSPSQTAKALGLSESAPHLWIKKGLNFERISANQVVITSSDLRRFFEAQPQRAYHIESDRLMQMFDDPAFVDFLKNRPAPVGGSRFPRAVVCLPSGNVYPSLAAAATGSSVAKTSISNAIRRGRKLKGSWWAYVDELAPKNGTQSLSLSKIKAAKIESLEQQSAITAKIKELSSCHSPNCYEKNLVEIDAQQLKTQLVFISRKLEILEVYEHFVELAIAEEQQSTEGI